MITAIIKSYRILGVTFKKRFLKVLMLVLIGTALEIISLLSLIPIINSFQNQNQNDNYLIYLISIGETDVVKNYELTFKYPYAFIL